MGLAARDLPQREGRLAPTTSRGARQRAEVCRPCLSRRRRPPPPRTTTALETPDFSVGKGPPGAQLHCQDQSLRLARSRARGLPRRETPPLWEDCCEPGHAPLANSGSGTTRRNSAPLSGGLYHTRLLLFRKGVVCALSLHSTHRPGAFSSSGRPPTCLSGSPLQRREGVRKHHHELARVVWGVAGARDEFNRLAGIAEPV